MSLKSIAAVAVALAGALCAPLAAHAQADVQWSVTIGSGGYSPAPRVYAPAGPVIVQPAPVYVPAPAVVVRPAPVYGGGYGHRHPTRWDRDGDGIPNRHDRWDDQPRRVAWDSDRDGVPNRYDRFPRNPWRD